MPSEYFSTDRVAEQGPVLVVFRSGGLRTHQVWKRASTWQIALVVALEEGFREIRQPGKIDVLEVNLTHHYKQVDISSRARELSNVHRGVIGIELSDTRIRRVAPTEMIAQNIDFHQLIANFKNAARSMNYTAKTFEAFQCLLLLDGQQNAVPLFRGNTTVDAKEIAESRVLDSAGAMAGWMFRNVRDDGRMTYKYWPSNGRESSANNMIRQFMASVCLNRWAMREHDSRMQAIADLNLFYDLKSFYIERADFGYIEYEGKVKLGAAALAALAILENSSARPLHAERLRKLDRFIELMWEPSGRFRTWYRGQPRNGSSGENFYPGEALLYWASKLQEEPDEDLLQKFMKSFRYYRDWHKENVNPAFIPWHSQAYFKVWKLNQNEELKQFVFEMNDWLIDYQQWERAVYPDMRGRFYDPARAYYGPPHASSTGVYLEGLADAYALAREFGDSDRMLSYKNAILRGIRSLLQLQFLDDADMYYISKRDRVRGALRTTVYNNEIRIDNVQHSLMALMKILDILGSDEYEE